MARILAVDWDGVEARFALGSIQKDRLVVLNAGAAPIEVAAETAAEAVEEVVDDADELEPVVEAPVDEDSETDEDDGVVETVEKEYVPRMPVADDEEEEEDVAPDPTVVSTVRKSKGTSFKNSALAVTLKKLFRERKVGSATLCYTAERGDLDVMYMTIPNASETETPELIFNQALRDSLTFNETQPLDYMTLGLPDSAKRTGFRRVAAVSIARDKLRRVRETLAGAYHAPAKIELREPSLAEFLRAEFCGIAYDEPVVLIQELCDEVNLALCYRKSVLYFRSFKILATASPEDRAERIREEIVRTLAIGLDDLPEDAVVNRALLFTDYVRPKFVDDEDEEVYEEDDEEDEENGGLAPALAKLLEEEAITLDFVNPFRLAGMRVKTPEPIDPGRYASLLGVILAERPQNKPAVDLLHPHEKPKPPNFTLLFVAYFFLAALLAVGAYYYNKSELRNLNAELENLEKERQKTVAEYNQHTPLYNVLRNANSWQNVEGVIVLDELRDIFTRLPQAPDLVVTRLAYMARYSDSTGRRRAINNRPVFIISAKITERQVYQRFKSQMELGRVHSVFSDGPVNNTGGGGYKFMFEAFIVCGRRNPQSLLALQSQEIKNISANPPEHFVEMEEERKRKEAETQEKNYADALAVVENSGELLGQDPAAAPAEGEAPVTTIDQDREYGRKLSELRVTLRQRFSNVNQLAQNKLLTVEQFNRLKSQYDARDSEIAKKYNEVAVRVTLKAERAALDEARKEVDAALETVANATQESDFKLRQILVNYRSKMDADFMAKQRYLQNGVISQAQFDAVAEKYKAELDEVVKAFNEAGQRMQTRANQQGQPASGQPAAPAEPQPAPEQPAAPTEPQPAPEQPAAPTEPQPAPEQPTAPAEPQPAPEQPAAPAEPQPAPEPPAAPAEPQPAPEPPAAPAEPQPAPEPPAAPAEPQPAPETPAAPAEPQPAPEQPAAPAEPQAANLMTTSLIWV